jgi:predicted  nucleic acid-binding Zn-ribbon protein
MNALLQNLLKLQSIEFGEVTEKNSKALAAELRGKIPAPILGHYDRLRARGKKGLALVRNQVCGGCHMQVPLGVITTLMHDQDIQLCGNCGRYLCLPEEPKTTGTATATVHSTEEKPPRKRKTTAHTT